MMPPQTIQHISVENILLRILVSVILKKENGGLSSARNIGIERSIGTYLTFVDSSCILSKRELFDQITFPAGRIKEDIGTNYKLFMQVKK